MNKFNKNLLTSFIYYKEIIFFNLLILSALILFTNAFTFQIILIIIGSSLILLWFLGKKRNDEIAEINKVIDDILKNSFNDSSEIELKASLKQIEDGIKSLFNKSRNDLNYLKKLELMRSQFIANVSHELRTPIFSIQGYLETLQNGAIHDNKVNLLFLGKALKNTINLNDLLNDLIDISRIESGEMKMSFRYFKLEPYLQEILSEFENNLADKPIELILHPVKSKLEIFADRNRLKQVFVNLINNAIKYTEEGKIEIVVEELNKEVKFSIIDSGIGIPKEDIPRIFERFYRVDKARHRLVGGTGLGLAIAKHIIEAHNSIIEVQSEVNNGSKFSFKLKK